MIIIRTSLFLFLLVGLFLSLDCGAVSVLAEEGDAASPQTEPADEFELETLDDELFEGLDETLDGGEDIQLNAEGEPATDEELGKETDPATRIGHLMRRVEQLLQEQDISQPTRDEQKKIVRELEGWLKELEKQRKKGQNSKPSASPKPGPKDKRDGPKQPGKQPAGKSGDPSATPGQKGESDEQIVKKKQEKVEFDDIRGNVEEFWGGLPEKERELLRQMADVELLPEYAPLIRRYFRRLAEDKRDRP